MKDAKIKSCPFCGSKKVDIVRTNPSACWIACANPSCEAETKGASTRNSAIFNWNRRTEITTLDAEIVFDMDRGD